MSDSGQQQRRQPPSPLVFAPDTILSPPPSQASQNGPNTVSMPFVRRHVTRRLKAAKAECDKELQRVTNNITAFFEERLKETEYEPDRDSQLGDFDHMPDLQPIEYRSALLTDESSSDGGYEAEQEYHSRHSRHRPYCFPYFFIQNLSDLFFSIIYFFLNEPKLSPQQAATERSLGQTLVYIHVFRHDLFFPQQLNCDASRNLIIPKTERYCCSAIMEHSEFALEAVVAYNTYPFATAPIRPEFSLYIPFSFSAPSPAKSSLILRVSSFLVIQQPSFLSNID